MDLNIDEPFLVKESSLINYLLFFFFFVLGALAIYTMYFAEKYTTAHDEFIFALTFGPSFIFLAKAIRGRTIMEVNKSGIFYNGKLVTDFNNFVRANIEEIDTDRSMEFKFVIAVEYYVPEKGTDYIIKLDMTSTQDKSEEEVIAAIQFFENNVVN